MVKIVKDYNLYSSGLNFIFTLLSKLKITLFESIMFYIIIQAELHASIIVANLSNRHTKYEKNYLVN